MKDVVKNAYIELKKIKFDLLITGDYETCKNKAKPYIEIINKEGKKVARKLKMKFNKVTFADLMRNL